MTAYEYTLVKTNPPPPSPSQMGLDWGPPPPGTATTPGEGAIWMGQPYHCQAKWKE